MNPKPLFSRIAQNASAGAGSLMDTLRSIKPADYCTALRQTLRDRNYVKSSAGDFSKGLQGFVGIDVETTGLNPEIDQLLQVALLPTSIDLSELAPERPYEAIVYYSKEDTAEMRRNADPYVRDMHDKTGLWEKLPSGKPLEVIESEMVEYVKEFFPVMRSSMFIGSSLRLDMNFVDRYLPSLGEHIHYRSVDVSTLQIALSLWGGAETIAASGTAHTALDDIRNSLARARFLRSAINRNVN